MSKRALLQYLELIQESGIDHVFTPAPVSAEDKIKQLAALREENLNCMKCPLAEGRIELVFGSGNPDAKAMLIGEAPGDNENKTGLPFVGAAGQLLDKMLAAINLTRDEIYIANIVKCRPPENRNPAPEERIACLPILLEQIKIIRPKVFLIMGLVAAQTLFAKNENLGWFRTNRPDLMGIPTYVTYHPAALIRNQNWKRPAWEDLQEFQKTYESL